MSLPAAQGLWRRALPRFVRNAAAPTVTRFLEAYVRAVPRPPFTPSAAGLPIRVVGLFEASHGIGAAARLAARAFEALGVRVETVELAGDTSDWARRRADATPAVWLFYLNAPELVPALARLGPRLVAGPRYGCWAWELPRAPAGWLRNAALVDEVLVPSRYTAEALAGARARVRVVPHPLFLEDYEGVAPAPRRASFQAVALFDFQSSAARKNPQGAIEAFRRAFGDDRGCELTVKTQNGARFPELLATLRQGAPGNVRIVDEVWPYETVKQLIAGADVLVSLHRAEGFGLPIAEAMALGAPVVATAFSGALDIMDETSALMVPWRPVPVADPQGIYRGQQWAEPDLDAAAAALVRLRDSPELRLRLGEAGRHAVAQKLSPKAWFRALPQTVQTAALAARQQNFGIQPGAQAFTARPKNPERQMSILGSILSKIFHPGAAKAAPAPQPSVASAGTAAAPEAPQAPQPVDVEAVLELMAKDNPQTLDWRHSIVDLMKLLSLESSFTARKQLAEELGYTGDTGDSASMNVWLHKAVMQKLAENGGLVPDSLR